MTAAGQMREMRPRLASGVPPTYARLPELCKHQPNTMTRAQHEAVDNSIDSIPHSAIEKKLLAIWSAILASDSIGVEDDFLSLGGDSLAAMRCINRVRAELDVELPLELFLIESASIADVARAVATLRAEALPGEDLP
jgi:acyl carrier protein